MFNSGYHLFMPPDDTYRMFSLRLPVDLDAELRRKAQQHDRSAGAELRSALREHLEAQTKPVTERQP